MILLRVYCNTSCYAEYLVGCDIVTMSITWGEALWLEWQL